MSVSNGNFAGPHHHAYSEHRGKVARCNKTGRHGVVTHQVQYFDNSLGRCNVRYMGFTLDNRPWESTDITVVHHSVWTYITHIWVTIAEDLKQLRKEESK
jgi:hypothetical protein